MRNTSHKTKLTMLLHYVDIWRQRVGSREAVALIIVEKHRQLNMGALTGIRFERDGDAFTLAKNAADRIFRWLDDKTKDGNLMPANFERSILEAMPGDLRLMYLNEQLGPLGLFVKIQMQCVDGQAYSIADAQVLFKELTEAIDVMLALTTNATPELKQIAVKELAEASAQISKSLSHVAKLEATT